MRRKSLIMGMAVGMAVLLPAILAPAQDFQKAYSIPAGGQILIRNISGDIKITGYGGDSILVSATKTGRDKDKVAVEDLSSGNRVDLKVKYPDQCNCNVSVSFEVRVPSGVGYSFDRLASVSGNIDVAKVRGNIKANSVSGDIAVAEVTGIVNASTVSGDVEVQITGFEGTGDMKLNSVSGSVRVKAPLNKIDANVEMSSLSGTLNTDFPLEVEEQRMGPGRHARGRLGNGSSNLRISTVSGKVSFMKN